MNTFHEALVARCGEDNGQALGMGSMGSEYLHDVFKDEVVSTFSSCAIQEKGRPDNSVLAGALLTSPSGSASVLLTYNFELHPKW